MTRKLILLPLAKSDLRSTRRWYESQRKGLGREFTAEIDKTFALIVAAPKRFKLVRAGVRRALVYRFPYVVYFLVDDRQIEILTVMHSRRDASNWLDQLEEPQDGD